MMMKQMIPYLKQFIDKIDDCLPLLNNKVLCILGNDLLMAPQQTEIYERVFFFIFLNKYEETEGISYNKSISFVYFITDYNHDKHLTKLSCTESR